MGLPRNIAPLVSMIEHCHNLHIYILTQSNFLLVMRLLNARTFELKYFPEESVPPYVILSHTWGPANEEVIYQDFENLEKAKEKPGFRKIDGCCSQARRDKFKWVWIDSCCIDKTSSVELSEAINSMFQWYRRSHICYAYLSDVVSSPARVWAVQTGDFYLSRWFFRGWTLQELIAPQVLNFYNHRWEDIGTKSSFAPILKEITGIPVDILRDGNLSEYCVAEIMSWAWNRDTTRVEDMAYSLLGLFNINLPLLYGEGNKAFVRLQEEILRTTGDYSLLAWTDDTPSFEESIFASSPRQFRKRTSAYTKDPSLDLASISPPSVWGGLLRIQLRLGPGTEGGDFPACLNCQCDGNWICIIVQPNSGYEKGTWKRCSTWAVSTTASLSEFRPTQLCFKINTNLDRQTLYDGQYTSFALTTLPNCMSLLPSKRINSNPIEMIVDHEKVQGYVHDTADSNDITSVQISHKPNNDHEASINNYPLNTLPKNALSRLQRYGLDDSKVSLRYRTKDLFDITTGGGVIELTLSTFGLNSRAAWCDLCYLQDDVVRHSVDSSPQNSDRCSLFLGQVSETHGRFLTASVKPIPQVGFAVEISCSAVDLIAEAKFLAEEIKSNLVKSLGDVQ